MAGGGPGPRRRLGRRLPLMGRQGFGDGHPVRAMAHDRPPNRRIVNVAAVAFRVLIGILRAVDPVVSLALGDGGAELVFGGLLLGRPRSPLRGQRLLQPFDALVGAASGCRRRRWGRSGHHANARSVLRQFLDGATRWRFGSVVHDTLFVHPLVHLRLGGWRNQGGEHAGGEGQGCKGRPGEDHASHARGAAVKPWTFRPALGVPYVRHRVVLWATTCPPALQPRRASRFLWAINWAMAQEAARASAVSARLVSTMGTRAPSTTPARTASARYSSCLATMLPDSRSGTTRISACPATADRMPLVLAATKDTALSKARGPSSSPPLICPRSAILQRAAASRVERIFELTVSTAARMATLGAATPAAPVKYNFYPKRHPLRPALICPLLTIVDLT